VGGFVYVEPHHNQGRNTVGFYEYAAAAVIIIGLTFCLGMYAGVKMADDEWKTMIDIMRRNPNITKQELIFRLAQRK